MKWIVILATLLLVFIIRPQSVQSFEYTNSQLTNAEFTEQNLIQNGWFVNRDDCRYSDTGWTTDLIPSGIPPNTKYWAESDKYQDPIDISCDGTAETGFAARFADKSGAPTPFYPNTPARIWQVVGPVNPNDRTLHFHALIVAHRVLQYKAQIYGGNSQNGPWLPVWSPFDITCTGTETGEDADCVNEKFGHASNTGDRTNLWDDVSGSNPPSVLGSLDAIQTTISQGFSFYKVEFSMTYPQPDGSATGNVGGKLARVFFKVSGSGSGPTSTPNPLQGDIEPPGGDGDVDLRDYQTFIPLFRKTSQLADFNSSGLVDIYDYSILISNF